MVVIIAAVLRGGEDDLVVVVVVVLAMILRVDVVVVSLLLLLTVPPQGEEPHLPSPMKHNPAARGAHCTHFPEFAAIALEHAETTSNFSFGVQTVLHSTHKPAFNQKLLLHFHNLHPVPSHAVFAPGRRLTSQGVHAAS